MIPPCYVEVVENGIRDLFPISPSVERRLYQGDENDDDEWQIFADFVYGQ
jgi:hypothetical protein